MKKFGLIFLFISLKANAWMFYPSMNLSNANPTMCVPASSNIGDKIRSASGSANYAVIKSMMGFSSSCNSQYLALANIQFINGATPKFNMEVPDEFKASKSSDLGIFHGVLLSSSTEKGDKSLFAYYRQRETIIPPSSLLSAVQTGLDSALKEPAIIKNQEELVINGMKAWRFEMIGTEKGIFTSSTTWQITMLEGDTEYIIVSASTKTTNYEENKQNFSSYAYKVSGIKSNSESEASAPKDTKIQINNAKQKCLKLGLKEKTEKFGLCVLENLN
jgi:hypothetical protein